MIGESITILGDSPFLMVNASNFTWRLPLQLEVLSEKMVDASGLRSIHLRPVFGGAESGNRFAIQWLGGSDKRSVWRIHIPLIFPMKNGEPVGASQSFPTIY